MPGAVLASAAATLAQAATEGASLFLLVPLLALVGLAVGDGPVADLAARVRVVFAWFGLRPALGPLLAGYVAAVALQALCGRWQTIAALTVEHRFVAALRKRLYAAVTHATWKYLSARRASDLGHSLTQDLERVGIGTYQVLSLFSNAVVAAVYLILALRLSAAMTLIVAACGLGLLGILRGRVRTAREEGEVVARATGRLFATAVEYVSSLRVAKSYGAEQRHIDSFAAAADGLADAHIQAIQTHAGSRAWFDAGAVAALALMLYAGLAWLHLPAAGVLLLLYVFGRTMPRLSAIQQASQNVSACLASFDAVMALQSDVEAHGEAPPAPAAEVSMARNVVLDRVSFAHDGRAERAVSEVTLDVRAGTLTAIVGESGAGKSTVGDLLTGLQRPMRGRLLVDGVDIDERLVFAWRRRAGYVDQDTFLFNDTIRANLLWANPGASQQSLDTALRSAAADFVFELPDGVDTVVGDRGALLSGGERQRLALARALVREPQLLLLDEATSALDADHENRILDAIDRLKGRMTIVLITHHLSAVRRADVIHVMHDGSLAESGDWGTLTSRAAGRFRALCLAQGVDVAADPPALAAAARFESR